MGHQKRIRKLVRMLSFSAGLQVVVWEECYWRWRSLNESMYHLSGDNIDGIDSTSHPQQARSLSLFFRIRMISCLRITGGPFSMAKSDFVPCCFGWILCSSEEP